MVGGVQSSLKSNLIPAQDAWRIHKKNPCVHQDPRERSRDGARPACVLRVSFLERHGVSGSIMTKKASRGNEIPAELSQLLKDDAVKVLHSVTCQQIWKTQQWPQDWKRSVFIPISKKCNAKECSNCCTTALISHASKVTLKILQARLQQYVNCELSDVQAGFRKGRGTRDQIADIH